MFVLFLQNFQKKSVFFYIAIIAVVITFSCFLGSWSGNNVYSVAFLEPVSCSARLRNQSYWIAPNATAGCVEDNVIGKAVKSVSFTFRFSTGGATHWIHALKASLMFPQDTKATLENPQLKFEGTLFFLDKNHSEKEFVPFYSAVDTRKIHCSTNKLLKGFSYGCTNVPVFQLLQIIHDDYQFEIRFIGDCFGKIPYISDMQNLKDLRLVLRHQRVPFAQAKAYLKAFFCPLTLFAHLWFHEAHAPFRTPIERILYAHSAALAALNIPFEYFLLWLQCPLWILSVQITEMAFQTTLLLSWLVFYKVLFNPKGTEDISNYRVYLFLLFWWYALGILDIFERRAVQQDPFYTPWENSVTMVRELVSYEMICSIATLLVSIVVVYQLIQMYSKISSEQGILLDFKAKKILGFYKNSAFAPFMVCMFSCIALAILQFSMNKLMESQWKMHMFVCEEEWCVMQFLLAPGVFTLFSGIANVLSISALLLTPTNVALHLGCTAKRHTHKEEESDPESLPGLLRCRVEKPNLTRITKVEKEFLDMLQLWVVLEEDLAKEEEKFLKTLTKE